MRMASRFTLRLLLIAGFALALPDALSLEQEDISAEDLEALKKNAEKGESAAQWLLGMHYRNQKDNEKAVQWYRMAADQGFRPAQYSMFVAYSFGMGVKVDTKEAQAWLEKARKNAKQDEFLEEFLALAKTPEALKATFGVVQDLAASGNSFYQMALGIFYLDGKGCEPDPAKGVEWLKKAADGKVAFACSYLAGLYKKGEHVEQDMQAALKWAEKGADLGEVNAMLLLIDLYVNYEPAIKADYNKSAKWMRKAAELGSPMAQWVLGLWLLPGGLIKSNPDEAVAWLTKAAEQGEERAFGLLAQCYFLGCGSYKPDGKLVEKWATKALDCGNAAGAYWLSQLYYHGRPGVNPDLSKSLLVLLEVNPELESKLHVWMVLLGEQGISSQSVDRREAIQREYEAFEKDALTDAEKAFCLHKIYQAGTYRLKESTVEEKKKEGERLTSLAMHWQEKAIALGHKEAIKRIFELNYSKEEAKRLANLALDIQDSGLLAEIAFHFQAGFYFKHDVLESWKFLSRAIDLGLPEGCDVLGKVEVVQEEVALKAARQGDLEAQFLIYWLKGQNWKDLKDTEVTQDLAREYLIKAAKGGLKRAQTECEKLKLKW